MPNPKGTSSSNFDEAQFIADVVRGLNETQASLLAMAPTSDNPYENDRYVSTRTKDLGGGKTNVKRLDYGGNQASNLHLNELNSFKYALDNLTKAQSILSKAKGNKNKLNVIYSKEFVELLDGASIGMTGATGHGVEKLITMFDKNTGAYKKGFKSGTMNADVSTLDRGRVLVDSMMATIEKAMGRNPVNKHITRGGHLMDRPDVSGAKAVRFGNTRVVAEADKRYVHELARFFLSGEFPSLQEGTDKLLNPKNLNGFSRNSQREFKALSQDAQGLLKQMGVMQKVTGQEHEYAGITEALGKSASFLQSYAGIHGEDWWQEEHSLTGAEGIVRDILTNPDLGGNEVLKNLNIPNMSALMTALNKGRPELSQLKPTKNNLVMGTIKAILSEYGEEIIPGEKGLMGNLINISDVTRLFRTMMSDRGKVSQSKIQPAVNTSKTKLPGKKGGKKNATPPAPGGKRTGASGGGGDSGDITAQTVLANLGIDDDNLTQGFSTNRVSKSQLRRRRHLFDTGQIDNKQFISAQSILDNSGVGSPASAIQQSGASTASIITNLGLKGTLSKKIAEVVASNLDDVLKTAVVQALSDQYQIDKKARAQKKEAADKLELQIQKDQALAERQRIAEEYKKDGEQRRKDDRESERSRKEAEKNQREADRVAKAKAKKENDWDSKYDIPKNFEAIKGMDFSNGFTGRANLHNLSPAKILMAYLAHGQEAVEDGLPADNDYLEKALGKTSDANVHNLIKGIYGPKVDESKQAEFLKHLKETSPRSAVLDDWDARIEENEWGMAKKGSGFSKTIVQTSNLFDKLGDAMEKFSKALLSVTDAMGKSGEGLGGSIANVLSDPVGSFMGYMEAGAGLAFGTGHGIGGMVSGAGGMLKGGGSTLMKGSEGGEGKGGGGGGKAAIAGAVLNIVGGGLEILGGGISMLTSMIQSGFQIFTGMLSGVLKFIKQIAETSPLIKAMMEILNLAFTLVFLPMFTVLGDLLMPLFVEILDWAIDFGETNAELLKNIFLAEDENGKTMIDKLKEMWLGLQPLIERMITEFLPEIFKLMPNLLEMAIGIVDMFLKNKENILNMFKEGLKVFEKIVSTNWLNTLLDFSTTMLKFMSDNWHRIIDMFEGMVRITKSVLDIANAITFITDFLTGNTGIQKIAKGGISIMLDQLGDTIGLAEGGYVPARPGGTLAILGEGGRGETVVPDGEPFGNTTVYNLEFNGPVYNQRDLEQTITKVINSSSNKGYYR